MSFTFRQLRYFVAVAETGTVTGAAHELSISQSTITEAIKELERDLGVTLFERHARGLSLTHRGNQFLRHATQILSEVAHARAAFDEESHSERGTLNLGVTSLVAGYVLSDLLSRFRRVYPDVAVKAIEDNGEYLEHLLIGGELDVAVMVVSGARDRMALQTEILEISPYRLWLPIGHRLASQDAIELQDLVGESFIFLTIDEVEEDAGRIFRTLGWQPDVAFRTRSVEAVRSLVATGGGIAILPELVYRPWSLEGDRIESRDLASGLPVVQVGVAWRRGLQLSAQARGFIAVAQAQRPSRPR